MTFGNNLSAARNIVLSNMQWRVSLCCRIVLNWAILPFNYLRPCQLTVLTGVSDLLGISDDICSKLQQNNVFTVARRNVEGQELLYFSIKYTNQIYVLSELKMQDSSPALTVSLQNSFSFPPLHGSKEPKHQICRWFCMLCKIIVDCCALPTTPSLQFMRH